MFFERCLVYWNKSRGILGLLSVLFLAVIALAGPKVSAQNGDSGAANGPLSLVQMTRSSLDPIEICARTEAENFEHAPTIRRKGLDFTVILTTENHSCSVYNESVLETDFRCEEKEAFNCIKGAIEALYGVKITNGKLLVPEGQSRDGGDGKLKIIFNYSGQIFGGRSAESSQSVSCHFVADGLAWLSLSSARLYLRETINLSECGGLQ